MGAPSLVSMLFEAWKDMDRVVVGLSAQDAGIQMEGGSAFSWTVAHVTNQLDGYINVRFQGMAAHPLIGNATFRFGGPGAPSEWTAVQRGVQEVRERARSYLARLTEDDLDRSIPYDGTLAVLQRAGKLSLRYTLTRIVLHHYYHIGEIATKRVLLGHDVGDYPGDLEECL